MAREVPYPPHKTTPLVAASRYIVGIGYLAIYLCGACLHGSLSLNHVLAAAGWPCTSASASKSPCYLQLAAQTRVGSCHKCSCRFGYPATCSNQAYRTSHRSNASHSHACCHTALVVFSERHYTTQGSCLTTHLLDSRTRPIMYTPSPMRMEIVRNTCSDNGTPSGLFAGCGCLHACGMPT